MMQRIFDLDTQVQILGVQKRGHVKLISLSELSQARDCQVSSGSDNHFRHIDVPLFSQYCVAGFHFTLYGSKSETGASTEVYHNSNSMYGVCKRVAPPARDQELGGRCSAVMLLYLSAIGFIVLDIVMLILIFGVTSCINLGLCKCLSHCFLVILLPLSISFNWTSINDLLSLYFDRLSPGLRKMPKTEVLGRTYHGLAVLCLQCFNFVCALLYSQKSCHELRASNYTPNSARPRGKLESKVTFILIGSNAFLQILLRWRGNLYLLLYGEAWGCVCNVYI